MRPIIKQNGVVDSPTLVLALKSKKKLGVVQADEIVFTSSFNAAAELSCRVYKFNNGILNPVWNELKDFRLLWYKEADIWFQISTEIDESDSTVKNITGVSLCESELSQINLYNIEINTDADINREEYTRPTILYDEEYPEASLLDRIMEKTPHYRIVHVDNTIKKIQRTFSFDDTSIYDAMQSIAEEIGCIFIFNSGSKNGFVAREISVYDLENNCEICGYRGEFSGNCPSCGEETIKRGYGKDSHIFVSIENLAEQITYSADNDSVKNCFRVSGGDDLIDSTVRNCNPNGDNYIWYFSADTKRDMSPALLAKLAEYDNDYKKYRDEYSIKLDSSIVSKYNNLVKKYNSEDHTLSHLGSEINGYSNLMNIYYDTIDFALYLRSTMMPGITLTKSTAKTEVAKLTASALSPISVTDTAYTYLSLATADNAVLSAAKLLIVAGYQVKVESSALSSKVWNGQFRVTSYSDESDTALSDRFSITIVNSQEKYILQKIHKLTNSDSTTVLDIVSLFDMNYDDFCYELKKHCLSNLNTFNSSCEAILNILIEQGVTSEDSDLYNKLYLPYYNKRSAIQSELSLRQQEINIICGTYDTYGNLVANGVQNYIASEQKNIQKSLNLKLYLGNDLWLEFCSYRRDYTYSNDNYISDGLNNAELFAKAQELIEVASKELYKSAELQHTISADLHNLLAMDEFSHLLDNFEIGNWIRIGIDNQVYKLRLYKYEIDFDSIDKITVEFTDVVKASGYISDISSVISKASSMATSYNAVMKQASQGADTKRQLSKWVQDGLDLTNTKIINGAESQEVVYDRNGILVREYFPVTESFSDKQVKLINKGLYVTDDNWKTSRAGIGNFLYFDPSDAKVKEGYGIIADTIVSNILLTSDLGIYNTGNTIRLNEDGFYITDADDKKETHTSVTINPNNTTGVFVIENSKLGKVLWVDKEGNAHYSGQISVGNGNFIVDANGNVTAKSGTFSGDITGSSGTFGGQLNIADNFIVDAKGNVTMNGNIDLSSGNISWGGANTPVTVQYSVNGTDWHDSCASTDYYARYSYDGGETYTDAIQIRGKDGRDGVDGKDGRNGSDADVPDYIQGTYIDFTKVESPSIKGNNIDLIGGVFTVKDPTGTKDYGILGMGTGNNGDNDTTGVVLKPDDNHYIIATDSGVRMQSGNYSLYVTNKGAFVANSRTGTTIQLDKISGGGTMTAVFG